MSLRNIKGYEIENFVQAQSLEWNMVGMSAAQCGIPFKETSLSYQPLCICDILKKYGYEQFFKVINSTNTPTRNLMSHYDITLTILNDLQILDSNQYKFGLGLSLYSNYKP